MGSITITGTETGAKIFTESIEQRALDQIGLLCSQPAFKSSVIRVMPDVHPGKVGTIGFTATLGDAVLPEVVGSDIGCGILLAELDAKRIEYQKLDALIKGKIPSGTAVRRKALAKAEAFDFKALRCVKHIDEEKVIKSLGTLGGGNHFIEVDRAEDGRLYLLIHSGSRSLGAAVTEYYMRQGQAELKKQGIQMPYEMTSLRGSLMEDYLHDLSFVQSYAELNRSLMLEVIAKGMKWKCQNIRQFVHNYVDFSMTPPVIRKGAVSAKKGETVIIPINMRDGVIIGTGLGNEEWNCSAPHGAGRVLKRSEVKEQHTLSEFKKAMQGIYSTCIRKDTLDEAPFAYRGLDEIVSTIGETLEIREILKPVYNFKAGDIQ